MRMICLKLKVAKSDLKISRWNSLVENLISANFGFRLLLSAFYSSNAIKNARDGALIHLGVEDLFGEFPISCFVIYILQSYVYSQQHRQVKFTWNHVTSLFQRTIDDGHGCGTITCSYCYLYFSST